VSEAAPPGRALRIGIDAHAVGLRKTGNERFTANLIHALRAVCAHELFLYVSSSEARARFASLPNTLVRVLRPRHPLLRIPLLLPLLAARDDVDVLLIQYTGPPLAGRPMVSVVHDVSFERFPENFRPLERLWMRRLIPYTTRRAARVVTVSEFQRREIVEVLGIDPARITVAHNGVDPIFRAPAAAPPSVPPPYFLAVGNLQPRKNLSLLIAAYERARARRPDLPERLVIVGQDAFAAQGVHERARALRDQGWITFTGYVDDGALVALLQGATAFTYPSLYEGFGLPPVEAMAAGVPCLVSDIPVMREIVGDAALRLPPAEVEAWSDALLVLSGDEDKRRELARRGRERSLRYTWQASARAVLSALEAAVEERG